MNDHVDARRRGRWVLAGALLASSLGALQALVIGPNLREARASALERGALEALRRLSQAQPIYRERHPELRYGSLAELQRAGLLSPSEVQPEGYRLEVRRGPDPHFCWAAVATPASASLARRHFATDMRGVIEHRLQPFSFRRDGSLDLPSRPLTPDG